MFVYKTVEMRKELKKVKNLAVHICGILSRYYNSQRKEFRDGRRHVQPTRQRKAYKIIVKRHE